MRKLVGIIVLSATAFWVWSFLPSALKDKTTFGVEPFLNEIKNKSSNFFYKKLGVTNQTQQKESLVKELKGSIAKVLQELEVAKAKGANIPENITSVLKNAEGAVNKLGEINTEETKPGVISRILNKIFPLANSTGQCEIKNK